MTVSRSLLTVSALTLPGLWGLPAAAQLQVNTGNQLDANLQVGSGGAVPAQDIPDFRARNLLITGQVTDGRQFRGDVGYGAAGAFGGGLGSDDLFRFRADAFSGAIASQGFGNALNQRRFSGDGEADLAGGNIIYNNFFTPGAAAAGPSPVRTVVSADGSRTSIVDPGASFNPEFIGVRALTGTAVGAGARDAQIDYRADTLGLVRDTEGRTLQLEASPVFGVTRTPIEGGYDGGFGDPLDNRRDDTFISAAAPATGVPGGPADPAAAGIQDGSRGVSGADAADPFTPTGDNATNNRAGNGNTPDARRGNPLDTRRGPGTESGNPMVSNPALAAATGRDPLAALPVSVQLGARLTPGANPFGDLNADAAADDDQRVARLGESIFRPLDATAAQSGDDAYLDLLSEIRDDFRGRQGGEAQPRRDGPATPRWMNKLDDATSEDLIEAAEEKRLNAIASVLRAQRQAAIAQGRDPDLEATPEEAAMTDAMASVIDQLSYDLPRLETLQGQRQDRVNTNFGLAEEALAKGKFFNAVSLYRQLTIDAPGNPLARVGLAHAEMGAGMIRSAALHLRNLFEDHPELIATRYAENLLPPEDRFVWLRDELQRQIDDPQTPNADAGFMLAYLGHQLESRQLVRYGLAVSQEAAPLDPLLPLLRKVWLGEDE